MCLQSIHVENVECCQSARTSTENVTVSIRDITKNNARGAELAPVASEAKNFAPPVQIINLERKYSTISESTVEHSSSMDYNHKCYFNFPNPLLGINYYVTTFSSGGGQAHQQASRLVVEIQ